MVTVGSENMMVKQQNNASARKSLEDGKGPDPKRRRIVESESESTQGNNKENSLPIQLSSVVSTTMQVNSNATTIKKGDGDLADDLPTTPLLRELQKIVDTQLSRNESLSALNKINSWSNAEDDEMFLKNFMENGGILKVLDFLNSTIDDGNCTGAIRMKRFELAAYVIGNVCNIRPGEGTIKQYIMKENRTHFVNNDGVRTLLLAHGELKQKGKQYATSKLNAAHSLWHTLSILSNNNSFSSLAKEQVSAVFHLGIGLIADMKSAKGPIAPTIMADVFDTMKNIVVYSNERSGVSDFVTVEDFEDCDIFSDCHKMFKKNGNFSRYEDVMGQVISFFFHCVHKDFFLEGSDLVTLFPIFVMGSKESFLTAKYRLRAIIMLICAARCPDTRRIKIAGAIEALSPLLSSNDVDEEEKDFVRTAMREIRSL